MRESVTLGHIRTQLGPWLDLHMQRRGRLLVGMLLMLLTALSALGLLAVSGWFITASALTGAVLAMGGTAMLDVYTPGGAIRLFAVSRTVSRYIERLYNHDTILRLLADLRGRLFDALVRMDGERLSGRRASDWLNRLTADIDTLDSLYLRLLAPPLVALLLSIALVALVGFWVPEAALWLGLALGVSWCWLTLGQARLGLTASRRRVQTLEELRSATMETLRGLAELEAYEALVRRREQLEGIEQRLLRDQWRLSIVAGIGNALAATAIGLCWVMVLVFAIPAFQAGTVSAPVMVMLPLAAMALSEGLTPLPAAFTQFGASLAAAERLNQIDECRSDEGHISDLPNGPLALSVEAVAHRYPGAMFQALEEVSLTLEPGQRVAVSGPSGAGKSTLLALISGQMVVQQGRILLAGHDIASLSPQCLSSAVGCLTQQVDLFDARIADNLWIADPEATEQRLWQALEAVDLADWAASLEEGLATRLGEGGRQLSGGQARRMALARLWLSDPGLVVLDEPFAGLDADTAERVRHGLEDWLAGRSVVYLVHEHDPSRPKPGMQGVTLGLELGLQDPLAWHDEAESVTM
ncbi:thiol reductant ABC exporter subunit CydC [Halomonas cupida]|uniref:thiol reductant ABC exporter subunit CydC n=1 Tax=Halomonas cupida TaxID=44933 RepID=UPI003A8DA45D